MIDSGSIQYCECQKRLEGLYLESHTWLVREAKKLTKHTEEAESLVSDLYVYLLEKCNPKIFYSTNTYNLFYCNKFLYSRWMNKVKILNKTKNAGLIGQEYTPWDEQSEILYDEELDKLVLDTYNKIQTELNDLNKTRMWPQAKIFQLYFGNDDTMETLAKKIGISKSTTFLAIKKIRSYLKAVIPNPNDEN